MLSTLYLNSPLIYRSSSILTPKHIYSFSVISSGSLDSIEKLSVYRLLSLKDLPVSKVLPFPSSTCQFSIYLIFSLILKLFSSRKLYTMIKATVIARKAKKNTLPKNSNLSYIFLSACFSSFVSSIFVSDSLIKPSQNTVYYTGFIPVIFYKFRIFFFYQYDVFIFRSHLQCVRFFKYTLVTDCLCYTL